MIWQNPLDGVKIWLISLARSTAIHSLDSKGAFTFGSIAWSEPEFVCSPLPRWTAFIFNLGPNRGSFASSSQQLFTPLLSNDGAGECGKMQKIALCTFIHLRFWTVCFVYKASVPKALTSVLRMCCKCSRRTLKANRNETYSSLLAARQSRSSGKWVKHTQTHIFYSNNMSLIAVHFRDLVRLRSHQQRTVLEFTWTVPQTTLFKRTRIWFAGAHPRSEDSVHIIQTNRTLTSIEPGCTPKVLVWKHPYLILIKCGTQQSFKVNSWLKKWRPVLTCPILYLLSNVLHYSLLGRSIHQIKSTYRREKTQEILFWYLSCFQTILGFNQKSEISLWTQTILIKWSELLSTFTFIAVTVGQLPKIN